jgi:hypothetical protein
MIAQAGVKLSAVMYLAFDLASVLSLLELGIFLIH